MASEDPGTLTQAQIDAAREFANEVVKELQTDKGVHAETAVASVARMAGAFLFRSFGFQLLDIEPGQVVISEQANDAGPRLIQALASALSEIGVALDEKKLADAKLQASQPNLGFLETLRRLDPAYTAIRARHGLSLAEAAEAGAVATAFMIHQCSGVLDPSVAFGVAVFGLIEGMKTAPHPVVH